MSTDNQDEFANPRLAAKMARNQAISGGARYGKTDTNRAGDDDRTPKLRCESCGEFVTRDFARVFGDNQNNVFGCLECMSASAIKRGGTLEDCDGNVADGVHGSDLYGGV